MKAIEPGFTFEDEIDGMAILKKLERIGRTCYKSEDLITEDSCKTFIKKIMDSGHESVIEHVSITVRVICDRGITHEIVRHRIASYSQESTRYCNYSKDKHGNEMKVILPYWFKDAHAKYIANPGAFAPVTDNELQYAYWLRGCAQAETSYFGMLADGGSAQEARDVLPNSLKTEIVMTLNLRSWINFFKQRTSKKAHPQMREIARPMLKEFQERIPVIFDDITYED